MARRELKAEKLAARWKALNLACLCIQLSGEHGCHEQQSCSHPLQVPRIFQMPR